MENDELDELNIKIATASGFRVEWWSIHPLKDWDESKKPADGLNARLCTMGMEVMLPDDKGDCPGLEMYDQDDNQWLPLVDWSHSLLDAMALLGAAERKGVRFEMNNVIPNSDPIIYEVRLYDNTGLFWYGFGYSVPEAICLAWLQWKEGV